MQKRSPKPSREKLNGLSPSEFKTLLKRAGHIVSRDFFSRKSSVSKFKGKIYRWRWWGTPSTGDAEFVVDISCNISEFDRWANSTEKTVKFTDWKSKLLQS